MIDPDLWFGPLPGDVPQRRRPVAVATQRLPSGCTVYRPLSWRRPAEPELNEGAEQSSRRRPSSPALVAPVSIAPGSAARRTAPPLREA